MKLLSGLVKLWMSMRMSQSTRAAVLLICSIIQSWESVVEPSELYSNSTHSKSLVKSFRENGHRVQEMVAKDNTGKFWL